MTAAAPLATLQQLGSRAMAWLHANHERGRGRLPDDVTIDLADPDNVYKPLGESALAGSLVLREGVAGPADTRTARELLAFSWAQLREGDLLYDRQLRYPTLTDPLETYAHFVRAGQRHPAMDELLASLARLRAARAVEHLPNRRLAVANARRTVGLGEGIDWPTLTAATWLGATPEPWALDWSTGYDITHTVFHVTDWGARPDELPEPLYEHLRAWLPAWIDVWLETGQWDLVGELLAVDSCIGEPAADPAAWAALADAQHEDGLLPRDTEPVDDDPARAFTDHEHTAVVAVVASTVTLSRVLGGSAAAA
ncbi:DUF6895 family protein [Kitasatospora sp. NPDC004240]